MGAVFRCLVRFSTTRCGGTRVRHGGVLFHRACVLPVLFGLVTAVTTGTAASAHAGRWRDDFEQRDLRDWEIYNLDRVVEAWDALDGAAVGEIFAPGFFSLLLLKPRNQTPVEWSDYTVRVRVNLLESRRDDASRVGLSLYDQELEGSRYLFHLAFDTKELQIVRATRDFWQVLLFPAPELQEEVWYDLTASVRTEDDSEVLTFQVDDGPEFTARTTGAFGSGGVGLVVSDGQAAFDELEIVGPNVPFGGRGHVRPVDPVGRLATTWAALRHQALRD